jgi:hypothetical protein
VLPVHLRVAGARFVDAATLPVLSNGGNRGPASERSRAAPGSAGPAACDDLGAMRARTSVLSKEAAVGTAI